MLESATKLVYLDQNKWIELAQAFHGRANAATAGEVLRFATQVSEAGTTAFVLSSVHYVEIARIGDADRRRRLGEVMWMLSRGYRIASLRAVVQHEIEIALASRFPQLQPRPFTLVSQGFAHAFGVDYPGYRIPEPHRSSLDSDYVAKVETAAREFVERSALTNEGPPEMAMPRLPITDQNRSFKSHLENLSPSVRELPPSQWEDMLYAISLADIIDPMNVVLARHALSPDDLASLGKEGLAALVQDMPSRRVDLHLLRQTLKNPSLRPRINDLEDWSGLGLAAAYCDVLVCERHFADLLLRDKFTPRATVITSLVELPEVLHAMRDG